MDILSLYQDHGVMIAEEDHKHSRPGWVQTPCPFCAGHQGFHLGYNLQHNYFVCWRCGHKGVTQALSKILGVNYNQVQNIIRTYKGTTRKAFNEVTPSVKKKAFRTPKNIDIFGNGGCLHYLIKRGFRTKEIVKLVRVFGISQTGPVSSISFNGKIMDLRFRVLAPIYFEGEMVSWQTRSIAKKSTLKYITCPGIIEKKDHKSLIYYEPEKWDNLPDTLVLVEGIFDVWKVYLSGFFCGCGFGVELTIDQIYWIKSNFKRVIFFLDSDTAGEKKSKVLFNQLLFSGIDCEMVKALPGEDPGSMKIEEIQEVLNPFFT